MKTRNRNHLEPVPSWQVSETTDTRKPNKGVTTGKLLGVLALATLTSLGYSQYKDVTTIDDNAQKIEVEMNENPTKSGMDAAREQLPENIFKIIDKSEMGSVITKEIYDETGEAPNQQGAHTLEVTIELDGDVEQAELIK